MTPGAPTIRALMLAQQARHDGRQYEGEPPTGAWVCLECDLAWPCADRVAADAVLATLDAADTLAMRAAANWGTPNEHGQFIITPGPMVDLGVRLIPDPEPS